MLAEDDDVAAVMIETIGVHTGSVPTPADVLKRLRALTAAAGVVLIFDEVVTGFRVSPGGAQGLYGVTPDLTLLGKVVAGGFPGGAVAGRSDILEWLDFDAAARTGREKIAPPRHLQRQPGSRRRPESRPSGSSATPTPARGPPPRRARSGRG